MNAMKSSVYAAGFALCAAMAGCATPLPPTQSGRGPTLPDPGADKEYQVKFPDPGHGMARYIPITIGEDIARECGLVQTHFELDSAEPLPQDQLVLQALAACLNRPSFSDIRLSLIGRADRHGDAGYNLALGQRRAKRVKELLVAAGMSAERISTSSRGDIGAVGGDTLQFSYGYDRRVDAVTDAVHAPR
jgi:outer membrane protein OmpA-like peptidoglycan-associated protein